MQDLMIYVVHRYSVMVNQTLKIRTVKLLKESSYLPYQGLKIPKTAQMNTQR